MLLKKALKSLDFDALERLIKVCEKIHICAGLTARKQKAFLDSIETIIKKGRKIENIINNLKV